MLAIESRYHAPTGQGADRHRFSAHVMEKAPARRAIVVQDDRLNEEENHHRAILALVARLGWNDPAYGPWYVGSTNTGYVAVCHAGEWTELGHAGRNGTHAVRR